MIKRRMENRAKDIEEMVALIDSLMEDGSMHVSVKADESAEDVRVNTTVTNECAGGACMQPTEKQELSEQKTEPETEPEQEE